MGWKDDSDIQGDTTDEKEQEENEEREQTDDGSGGESMSDDVDLSSLAPSATDVQEAAESEHIFKMMLWSDPGHGKTHFSYTMPEPVCIIDTENKADDIAHKFDDKEVMIWTPSDFDEACDYRDEALNLLSEYEAKTGQKGTLVVDSMADMWEWSQHKYISEWYPNTPPDKVNLELQDWPKIKDYHNNTFRKAIEECDYNVCWTSTRKDDVGKAIEKELDATPDKPGGETNNAYKVNSILKLYLDGQGVPTGDLQKSGLLRFKYLGLRRPTFEKHREIVERVEEIESNGATTAKEVEEEFDLDYDVSFTEATTMRFVQD
jgi:hypothetical protein